MIKVLIAALVGTAVGIAVMVIVIVSQGTTTSDSSSIGLTLSVSTSSPSSSAPSSSTTTTTTTGGGSTSTGGSSGDAAAGKTVFLGSAGCAGCHTFKAAGSTGAIGPDLDNISADDAAAGGMPLPDFVHESIVDPDKYIAKGYTAGIMPTTFGSSLSSTDIDNLVAFISENQTS
jgi:mono/diheme cytochrome c family protein